MSGVTSKVLPRSVNIGHLRSAQGDSTTMAIPENRLQLKATAHFMTQDCTKNLRFYYKTVTMLN